MTGWYMLHFMHSVPLYVYMPVVAFMSVLHGLTVYFTRRRILELENALGTRDILLGHDPDAAFGARVVAGGTLVQTFERPIRQLRVTSRYYTELLVEYDH